MNRDSDSDPINLVTAADVTPEILKLAEGCADANYGLGNHWVIDWERTYDMLESLYGYFVTEMGNPADRKIRRHVRAQGIGEGPES